MHLLSSLRRASTGFAFMLASLITTGAISAATAAERFSSAYTTTQPKDCRKVGQVRTGGEDIASDVACKGFGGLVVLRQMDDDRETISVGRSVKSAGAEPASSQGFRPFNSTADTVEWRLDSSRKPFAIIQRWRITDNENLGADERPRSVTMLVVTRLAPGPVCHVAYVDVAANSDANEIARRAADDWAAGFDCRKDAIRIGGQRGRAIDLAMPPKQ